MEIRKHRSALQAALLTPCLLASPLASAQSARENADDSCSRRLAEVEIDYEVRYWLASLTPEQRREMTDAAVGRMLDLGYDDVAAAGCLTTTTSGVLCQGTSGFTHGVTCCVLTIGLAAPHP